MIRTQAGQLSATVAIVALAALAATGVVAAGTGATAIPGTATVVAKTDGPGPCCKAITRT